MINQPQFTWHNLGKTWLYFERKHLSLVENDIHDVKRFKQCQRQVGTATCTFLGIIFSYNINRDVFHIHIINFEDLKLTIIYLIKLYIYILTKNKLRDILKEI